MDVTAIRYGFSPVWIPILDGTKFSIASRPGLAMVPQRSGPGQNYYSKIISRQNICEQAWTGFRGLLCQMAVKRGPQTRWQLISAWILNNFGRGGPNQWGPLCHWHTSTLASPGLLGSIHHLYVNNLCDKPRRWYTNRYVTGLFSYPLFTKTSDVATVKPRFVPSEITNKIMVIEKKGINSNLNFSPPGGILYVKLKEGFFHRFF